VNNYCYYDYFWRGGCYFLQR